MFWKSSHSYLHICVLSCNGHWVLYVYVWFVCCFFIYSAPTTNLNSNTTQTTRQSLACWDPIQGACFVEDEHIQFKQQYLDAHTHDRLSDVTWLSSHCMAGSQLLFNIEGDAVSVQ